MMALSDFAHWNARSGRRRARYAVLMLTAAIAALGACQGGANDGAPGGGRGGRGGGMPPMPVDVVTLELKPVEQAGEFVATVKSRRSTTIQPQAEGFLTRIRVRSGDRVSRGTPLFDIDATSQQAAVSSLQSLRAAREADAAFARQQAQRAKSLLGVGAMSQQEYEQAMTLQKTAEAQLKAVDDQIRQQQAELAFYRVTAPAAGIVGDIPVRVGDRVGKSTVLTTIDDNTGLEVYINVPVQQAPNLKVGLRVLVVSETGATLASERISFIAPSVDDETQTVLVKAAIGQAGQFRHDQFVRARIIWSTTPGLTVPLVSVVRINAQYFAFVAEDAPGGAVARQRAVTLGPVVGNEYIVLSGLKPGDRLIVSGIQKIADGAPVQPTAAAGRSEPGRESGPGSAKPSGESGPGSAKPSGEGGPASPKPTGERGAGSV